MAEPVLTPEERDGFEKLFKAWYDCRERRALCRQALVRLEDEILTLRARVEFESQKRADNFCGWTKEKQLTGALALRARQAEARVAELEQTVRELRGEAQHG